MGTESNRKGIMRSALYLSLLSIFTVLFSFAKESVIAYYYGVSADTDAYNISVDTPRIIFTFLSMAVSTVVIPIYTKVLTERGEKQSCFFFRNFTTFVLISYFALLLPAEILAPFIIKVLTPGLDGNVNGMTVSLFRITIPAIGLGLFCKINTGILNSHKSFLLPSLTPILFNLVMAGCVIASAERLGIYAATVGTVLGMSVELIFTSGLRKKYVSYKPVLDFRDEMTISALKMAAPVFVGMSAAELNLILDKMIASFFEAGSISALNYASKLSSGISTLFIASVTTVFFPELAGQVANKEQENAAKTYIFSIRIFILLLMPVIVGGVALSKEIMTLVYGRGAFDSDAVAMTTSVFACYFVCLLFTGLRQTGTNFLYSYGDSKAAMKNTVIGVGINLVLDIVLSAVMGLPGLALATTMSVAVISILLMRTARKKNPFISYGSCFRLLLKTFFACGVMFLAIWGWKCFWVRGGYYDIGRSKATVLFTVSTILVGAAVYGGMLLLLGAAEARQLLDIVKRKRRRNNG